MIVPQKLKIGAKIGIVATARKISRAELKPAIDILESWGIEVVLGRYLFEEYHQFSATISQRRDDLQAMIADESIAAILCARGGYGTVQLIDTIDFSKLIDHPKWLIGYSDVTVLHSHLNNLGLASLHASMPVNFTTNTNAALLSLKNIFFGQPNVIKCPSHILNRLGKVEGEIVGGNLSILYSLLGSASDIDTTGKILFIEDLDEYLYHIDRMMMNMKRNKKFENLKGLIVGGMSAMNDNAIPFGKTANQIISEQLKEYNFPICFAFPSGHLEDNRSLIFGTTSVLEITENGVSLSQ